MDIRKPATGNTTTMERIGNSTYSTVQHWRNNLASGGIVGGGVISDAGGGTINVAAGQCAIRPSASHTSTLYFADFPAATGLVIPTDTIRYVGVEYNAGSPIVALRTADDFDYMTNFPIGVVTNEAGVLHFSLSDLHDVSDSASHVAERFEHTLPFARDEAVGGIVLGETGTRNITVSSGVIWHKLRKLTISAFNSSTGGTFDIYYRAVSGFTKVAAQTQWPNTQYDNGTGTLATMGANKYAVLWFYMEPDDSMIIMLYGRGEYDSLAAAEAESPPATVPNRITAGGRIIGKLAFQKSAATASSIYSAFTAAFATTGASNHANLSNLDYASAGHTGFQGVLTNSAGLAAALSDETGTGVVVFNNTPTLIAPILGVATCTSINALTPTALATGFSIAGGTTSKTLTVDETISISAKAPIASPVFTTQISTPKIVTASGNLEITPVGNANVILQGSGTGNVGIGTTTPTRALEVKSSAANYAANIQNTRGDATGGGLQVVTNWNISSNFVARFASNGIGDGATEMLAIKGDGNVGIGTTSPGAVLHLKAGTTVANTAPLQFTSGPVETTPRAGLVEYDGVLTFTAADALRTPLNKQYVLASKIGANFNVTTDQSITIPAGRWVIRKIVVNNASISLTTAAGGLYTGASKTGTTIVGAAQAYSALTASGKFLDLTLDAAMATDILTATTIYFSLTTAQGAAATGDIFIIGDRLDY